MISAVSATVDCGGNKTLIAGKIYDSPNFENASGVPDATVYVTCPINSTPKNTTSLGDGTYSIEYSSEEGCCNTKASAYAEKYGFPPSNTQTADVQDYTKNFDLYLGVINLALIPEFGFFVGTLTLLSAVGVFFLVRRK